MPETPDVSAVTDDVLGENYDGGAIDRGRDYADDGRVRLLSTGPDRLSAVVAGSGRNTYLVNVGWRSLGGGVVVDDTCSCPLGGFCKHAVASILVARHEADEQRSDGPPAPSWRDVLADVVGADDAGRDRLAPLALQLGVAEPGTGRFSGDARLRLLARPMRPGKREPWIKTGATWRDLAGGYGTSGLVREHVLALRALWNASPRHAYHPDTGPIGLERFGTALWLHLANVIDAGVVLLDERGEQRVQLHEDPVRVDIDLTTAADGSVRLTAGFADDDGPLELRSGTFGFLGVPVHGLFTETPTGGLGLRRLERVADPAMLALVSGPPLVIPATDVAELTDEYGPLLQQRGRLGSSDGSVTVAIRRFDGLALCIERSGVDVAEAVWAARYVRDGTVDRIRLDDPDGRLRDRAGEAAAVAALEVPAALRHLVCASDGTPRGGTLQGVDAVRLLTDVVTWATAAGIEVVVTTAGDGDVPELRESVADPLISLDVTDAGDADGRTDWFDLSVSVSVDGEQVPFAVLFRALNAGDELLVLPTGTWLRLDRPEFARLRALITEARGLSDDTTGGDTVRINPFQLSWFDELAALGVIGRQSARWRDAVERLGNLSTPEAVEPPATLHAELRPYQQEGFSWLRFLERNDLGGILADDMGLGKTVQVLAACLAVLEERPDARFLVVAPTSVVDNWRREAERFAPSMSTTTITGTAKRRGAPLGETVGDASLVVTSYTLFRLERDDYAALGWDLLCLDEAQAVKNHHGKTYRAVRGLPARVKIAITGTPLENSLMDLWSLLSITAPGLFPDPERFSQVYRRPIEAGEAPELLEVLRRRIAPLLRRRTKADVLVDLPPKTEQIVGVELSRAHRHVYETRLQRERSRVLGLVEDMDRNRFTVFRSLTLLRQLSLDPGLVDEDLDHIGSAKLDRLVDDVTQIVAEGHRALVFSQFTRFLRRASARLDDAGVGTAYLDGSTRRRAEVIDTFKTGDVPVFLISLKAGGVGLNLAEADYCFILDPWWNPATEAQAVDRAHRIGQTNPVMVYRYVATGTIEEKVMALKARKAALFDDVLSADGSFAGALTADDIAGLFAP